MPNLVGIGNSQVPTNAMLGGLAYQESDNANLASVEIEKFAKIASQYQDQDSGAPNGIFIYDTKKDSDGGAWRKRTSHTSWYNEGPSPFRSSRKEFPSVAILMTYDDGFKILDADDPETPVWMDFPIRSYNQQSNWNRGIPMLGRVSFVSYSVGDICALNGQIFITNQHTSGGSQPGWMVNMINEKCIDIVNYGTGGNQCFWVSSNISDRILPYSGEVPYRSTRYHTGDDLHTLSKSGITGKPGDNNGTGGWHKVVRMFINERPVIDDETGLPMPTILLNAYTAGLCTLDATTDTNSSGSTAYSWHEDRYDSHFHTHMSNLSSDGKILIIVRNNPSTNAVTTGYYETQDHFNNQNSAAYQMLNLSWSSSCTLGVVWNEHMRAQFVRNPQGWPDDLAMIGCADQYYLYLGNGGDANASSAPAYISRTHNTGYMPGKCYMSTLCQTTKNFEPDSVAHKTSEKDMHVYSNSFGSNATGWTYASGAGYQTGSIYLDNQGSSRATLNNTSVFNPTQGRRYLLIYEHGAGGATENWQFDDDGAGAGVGGVTVYHDVTNNAAGCYSFIFTATASKRLRMMRTAHSNSANTEIYSVEIYELGTNEVNDAVGAFSFKGGSYGSSNSNYGLAAVGVSRTTIKRVPVEEGAELLAYTGWGTNAFLVRGYDGSGTDDLFDAGTGDFFINLWVRTDITSGYANQPLLGIGQLNANNGFLIELSNDNSSNNEFHYINVGYLSTGNSFASDHNSTMKAPLKGQTWNMVSVSMRSNAFRLYINGQYSGATWTGSSINWDSHWKDQSLVIGARAGTCGNGTGGSRATTSAASSTTKIALVRVCRGKNPDDTSLGEGEWRGGSDGMILRMYEDERRLFEKGAKCTLGEGDHATGVNSLRDLWYDEHTDRIHIATSVDTNEFNRLVRINSNSGGTKIVRATDGVIAEGST